MVMLALTAAACDDGGRVDGADVTEADVTGGDVVTTCDVDGDPMGDCDGDGLTNMEEVRGYSILVDVTGFGFAREGFLEERLVISDPTKGDTDDDGLNDLDEFLTKSDATRPDTDGDGLTDYAEVTRWQTSPFSVDTDEDARNTDDETVAPIPSLFDGAELALIDDPRMSGEMIPGPKATSPLLWDTDGDGIGDWEERQNPFRSPSIAELPEIDFIIESPVDVRLNVAYTDSESVEYGASYSQTQSSELSKMDGRSTTHSVESSFSTSTEVGFDPSDGFGLSQTVEYSEKQGMERSHTTEVTVTEAEQFESERSRIFGDTREISTEEGTITVGIKAINSGVIAYSLTDIGMTVRQFIPSEGRFRNLTTLQPADQFDQFAVSAGGEGTPIITLSGEVDAGVIKSLLANPTGLILEPAAFELYTEDNIDFVFFTEQTFQRTALIVLDYGDGNVDQLRVATNIDRDEEGNFRGVRLEDVLLEAGIEFEVNIDDAGLARLSGIGDYEYSSHDSAAPDLSDPSYPVGLEPGSRMARSYWSVFAASRLGEVALNVDFGAIRLQAGDEVFLVFDEDHDQDGITKREEYIYGSSDEATDTDGDGLSDYFEIRVARGIELVGAQESYAVFSNPLLGDADSDGLTDLEELTLGTDPNRRDTDEDGFDDLVDREVLCSSAPFVCYGACSDTPCPIDFEQPLSVLIEGLSGKLELGDLNGDGYLDAVALGAQDSSNTNYHWTNRVLLNDGTGLFYYEDTVDLNRDTTTSTSLKAWDVALGDVNNDGILDIVFANYLTRADSIGAPNRVYLGNGDGAFTFSRELGNNPSWGVALGDLTGDGQIDAVFANLNLANGADIHDTVYQGNAQGQFMLIEELEPRRANSQVALGDVNGDGHLDAILAHYSNPAVVHLNSGDGTFGFGQELLGSEACGVGEAALGDLNGDGHLDVMFPCSSSAKVYLNNGTGVFTAATQSINTAARGVALGDLDGDRDLDAIIAANDGSHVYINDGQGAFSPHSSFFVGAVKNVSLGDMNNDGQLDVVLLRESNNNSQDNVQVHVSK